MCIIPLFTVTATFNYYVCLPSDWKTTTSQFAISCNDTTQQILIEQSLVGYSSSYTSGSSDSLNLLKCPWDSTTDTCNQTISQPAANCNWATNCSFSKKNIFVEPTYPICRTQQWGNLLSVNYSCMPCKNHEL